MKSIILLFLFLGAFLVLSGIYEEKIKLAESRKKIEYKFIPRTYYEEQLSAQDHLSSRVGDMFKEADPWLERLTTQASPALFDQESSSK